MTLPLPDPKVDQQPWELERTGVQRNFDALARAAIDTGGRSIRVRFGTTSQTMPAATSGTFTVTHGMGSTPIVALCQPDGSGANDLTIGTMTYTSTQFTVAWRRASGLNPPSPLTFYWVAFG